MSVSPIAKYLLKGRKMCPPSTIEKALGTITVNKQHFLRFIHLFVIIFFVFVCMASWFSRHYVVTTYKYIYLQFSKRWFENESYREDSLNLISLLHLLSFLYNLICVASVLSKQPRIKGKHWLAKNPDNVLLISDMFTRWLLLSSYILIQFSILV
jgi:hypothetical protein